MTNKMIGVHRALAFSFLERYLLIALSLISYVLIARLLTPEEIGIYSVAAALTGIAQVIREFGIGSYLIQEKDIADSRVRSAFGLSIVLGGMMFIIFSLGTPLVGSFYEDERIVPILRIVALNFLVMPFCSVSLALLMREMRFDRLLKVNLAAASLGFGTTLALTFAGAGPQSLAWGVIACNVSTGLFACISVGRRNLFRPSFSGWRSLVTFGRQNTLAGVLVSAATDINDLVIGKVMGFAQVAIISRAMGIMYLFHRDLMGAVRNVSYPAFASAHREGQPIEPRFIASITAITAFGWPFYGFISLYPLEILHLLVGPQWDAAAPLVPVFAAAGVLSSTFLLIPTLVMAVGRVDLSSRADLFIQIFRMILIFGAAVVFKTLIACAIAFLISIAVATPVYFASKGACVPNDFRGLFAGFLKSLQVTAGALLIAAFLSWHLGLGRTSPMAQSGFMLVCLATAIAWFASVRIAMHPILEDPLFRRLTSRIPFLNRRNLVQ